MEGQTDRQTGMDSQMDIGTYGQRAPSFPKKGHKKLKIYSHQFLLGWTDGQS